MDKKRAFITFAVGDDYIRLSQVLKKSIESFSEYPIKSFGVEDFDLEYRPDLWKPGYIYIYKVLSCIKALEEYDEVVWLDNDCLATDNIDKIWDMDIEGYPLLSKHRFQNFDVWPHFKTDYSDPSIMVEGKVRVGVSGEFDNSYLQACCMFFDRGCLEFFKEVIGYFEDYDNVYFPYGDESIINLIRWRDNLSKDLGDVFLCSYYFSPYFLDEFIKSTDSGMYQDLFDISKRLEGVNEDGIILAHGASLARHNRVGLIRNNFEDILFFHGSKSTELHDRYLSLMIEHRKAIHS
jgi:hypothetical protein